MNYITTDERSLCCTGGCILTISVLGTHAKTLFSISFCKKVKDNLNEDCM